MGQYSMSDTGTQFFNKLNGGGGESKAYTIALQGGKLRNDGSVTGSLSVGSNDFYKYMHTPLFIEFVGGVDSLDSVTLNTGETLYINCYDGSRTYISQVTSAASIPSTTRYIKMMIASTSAYSAGRVLSFTASLGKGLHQVRNGKGGSVSTTFVSFETHAAPLTDESVTSGSYNEVPARHFDNGYVILPPNYDAEGKPVQLIVFVHGSGGYDFTESSVKLYGTYLEFLAKNGYAVADCSGQSDALAGNSYECEDCKCHPGAFSCFKALYSFLVNNYNIDTNGAYIFGKSAGGMMASQLAYYQPFPIKAAGNLAPCISLFGSDQPVAYKNKCDYTLAYFGYSNPNVTAGITDSASRQYVLADIDLVKAWDPFCTGTNLDLAELTEAMWTTNYHSYASNTAFHALVDDAARVLRCPHKIWHAVDDDVVDIDVSQAYVDMAKRGGCVALLRKLPANTGKHHAVDNDSNAPKTNYTTTYGGVVNNIPIAYAELVDWFKRW